MKLSELTNKLPITLIAVSVLLCGCSGYSKTTENESSKDSAVVNYTCISNPDSDKKIFVILKNYHGNYWKSVIEGISSASEKTDAAIYLGGIDNETDLSGQVSLIDEALKEEADGILLAPANSNSLTDSCQKIKDQEIPLVLIDSSVNSEAYDACYMTDNIDAGEQAAEEMLRLLYDAGNSPSESLEIGILLSSDSSQAMVNRVSGFLDYWADHAPEQWDVAKDIRINGGNVKKAQSDAAALLEENSHIKGLFGCNNTSTIGIADTLLNKKRTDVAMVGFDLADETKELIQSEDYRGITLMQQQDQMGYQGILALDAFIRGEGSGQKFFDTGIIMINADYLTENDVS